MLKLIPFDPSLSDFAFEFYYNKAYIHFSRHVSRWLTRQECQRLPDVLNMQVLFLCSENEPVGIFILNKVDLDKAFFAIAIHEKHQRKKLFARAMELLEDYCFTVCNLEELKTDVAKRRKYLCDAFEKIGYSNVCEKKNGEIINGVLEDIVTFSKIYNPQK